MKKQLITSLGLITLGIFSFLSFSCGSEPNTNVRNTTAQNNSGANKTPESLLPPPAGPCDAPDLPRKIQAVKDDIKTEIDRDSSLKDQYTIGHFKYEVREMNGKIEVSFTGKISGEGKPASNDIKMDKFFGTFKKVLKKGCVERVVFGPFEAKADSKIIDFTRFEWGATCEAPLVECNGECVRICNPVGNTNSNGNGNSNGSNSNGNGNSNSNANSNSNINANTGSNVNMNKPT